MDTSWSCPRDGRGSIRSSMAESLPALADFSRTMWIGSTFWSDSTSIDSISSAIAFWSSSAAEISSELLFVLGAIVTGTAFRLDRRLREL